MALPIRHLDFRHGPLGLTEVFAEAPGHNPDQWHSRALLSFPSEGTSGTLSMDSGNPFGISADARIEFSGPADGWTFGFVQFLVFETNQGVYGGDSQGTLFSSLRTPAEQRLLQVDVDRHSQARYPWYSDLSRTTVTTAHTRSLTLRFQDRPSDGIALRRVHPQTRNELYLRHAWFCLQFRTVLAAKDPSARWHVLRTFAWSVEWNLQLTRLPNGGWSILPTPIMGKRIDAASNDLPASAGGIAAMFAGGFHDPHVAQIARPNRFIDAFQP